MSVRKFKIKIDGKLFEAEVEELTEGESVAVERKKDVQQPVTTGASESKTAFVVYEKTVTAPMPGKIIAVKCSPGQTVKRGEVVIILEAMKMEQEIKAKADGVISEIKVSAGMSVQKEDVLLIIS